MSPTAIAVDLRPSMVCCLFDASPRTVRKATVPVLGFARPVAGGRPWASLHDGGRRSALTADGANHSYRTRGTDRIFCLRQSQVFCAPAPPAQFADDLTEAEGRRHVRQPPESSGPNLTRVLTVDPLGSGCGGTAVDRG